MNSLPRIPVLAMSAAFALVFCSAAPSAHAAARCAQPTVGGEARACAARQEGPTALRRFILRTEMIYGFSYWDFQPAETTVLAAQRAAPSVGMRSADAITMAQTK